MLGRPFIRTRESRGNHEYSYILKGLKVWQIPYVRLLSVTLFSLILVSLSFLNHWHNMKNVLNILHNKLVKVSIPTCEQDPCRRCVQFLELKRRYEVLPFRVVSQQVREDVMLKLIQVFFLLGRAWMNLRPQCLLQGFKYFRLKCVLTVFKRHACRFLNILLSQNLVYIPDVARLKLFQISFKGVSKTDFVLVHLVWLVKFLKKSVAHKIVSVECDFCRSRTLQLLQEIKCATLRHC